MAQMRRCSAPRFRRILSPTSVMIAEGNRRLLMTPVLGQASGSNIPVYFESNKKQTGSDQRTWIDGIGYELITNRIIATLLLTNGDLSLTYSGSAGRQYVWE